MKRLYTVLFLFGFLSLSVMGQGIITHQHTTAPAKKTASKPATKKTSSRPASSSTSGTRTSSTHSSVPLKVVVPGTIESLSCTPTLHMESGDINVSKIFNRVCGFIECECPVGIELGEAKRLLHNMPNYECTTCFEGKTTELTFDAPYTFMGCTVKAEMYFTSNYFSTERYLDQAYLRLKATDATQRKVYYALVDEIKRIGKNTLEEKNPYNNTILDFYGTSSYAYWNITGYPYASSSNSLRSDYRSMIPKVEITCKDIVQRFLGICNKPASKVTKQDIVAWRTKDPIRFDFTQDKNKVFDYIRTKDISLMGRQMSYASIGWKDGYAKTTMAFNISESDYDKHTMSKGTVREATTFYYKLEDGLQENGINLKEVQPTEDGIMDEATYKDPSGVIYILQRSYSEKYKSGTVYLRIKVPIK